MMVEWIGSWVFLLIYGLICGAVVLIVCRWFYVTEIGDLRRAAIDLGELLHVSRTEDARAMSSMKGDLDAAVKASHNLADECKRLRQEKKQIQDELDKAVNDRDAVVKVNREIAAEMESTRKLNVELARERNALLDWKVRVGTKLGETTAEVARLRRELDDTEGRLLRAMQESVSFQGQLATAVGNLQRLISTGDFSDNVSPN